MKPIFICPSLKTALLLNLIFVVSGFSAPEGKAANANPEAPEFFAVPSTGGASLPFSEAVKLGDTLYVAGQLGTAPGTFTLVNDGIETESRRALENLKAVLERHGSSLNNVVKVTVFLADIKEWPAFNAIYRDYFKSNLPARSAFAVTALALGGRVEVEAIAFVPPKQ
jgi:reactive intermediate/imine deaminase